MAWLKFVAAYRRIFQNVANWQYGGRTHDIGLMPKPGHDNFGIVTGERVLNTV